MPRPSSRTVTRSVPRRTRARTIRCSGRSVFPCLIAFSTSGCTRNGGKRTARASGGASTRHLELRPEARLLELEVALHVAQLVVERDELVRAAPASTARSRRTRARAARARSGSVRTSDAIVFSALKTKCGSICACSAAEVAVRARRAGAAPTAGRRAARAARPRTRRAASRASRRRRPHRRDRRTAAAARRPPRPAGTPDGGTRSGSRAARAAAGSSASASKTGRIGASPAPWWSAPAPTNASTSLRSVTATAPKPSFSNSS